ncbi:hypothetical protein COF76_23130 [Bacillus wiedmannii]|uniref:HNH endonuclease n=1 Tax=Bacillus wiedmannii TaxID=1890302 RepID=UPI000BFBB05D|nr:HNH endonuclease signature motif containing protein [Bacillus wiedmannii]PHE94706.1 hypothetical protein COF76_23130 [Bacillus wiedmannii]
MDGKVCRKCKEWKVYSDYPENKKCKNGREGTCRNCRSEYSKRWHEENKESRAKKTKRWYEGNKERKAESDRRWYEKNKERRAEQKRKWEKENQEKRYSYGVKRRSLKHNVKFTPSQRTELLNKDNWTCQCCGIKVHDRRTGDWNTHDKAHIDHLIPLTKGGDSTPDNLQVLCRTCNIKKHNKTEIEIEQTGQVRLVI